MSELIVVFLMSTVPVLIFWLVTVIFERIELWLLRPSKKELRNDAIQLQNDAAEADRLRRNLKFAQDEADRFIAAQRLKAMLHNDRHF